MAQRDHELKVWPNYFGKLLSGEKPFEVRKDDRDFQTGDRLLLREWCPNGDGYTGREMQGGVGYLLRGPAFGIEPGHVVFAVTK